MITTSPLWLLVSQSDAATWCILLVLLTMSVVGWSIAFYKWTQLNTFLREVQAAIQVVERKQTRDDFERSLPMLEDHAGGRLLRVMGPFLAVSIVRYRASRDIRSELLMIRDDLDSALTEEVSQADTYTSVLRTCAEAAPLLGLLGTIWGLIHSFIRISSERVADIVTVAPGIAEALITTLVGLLVAIPALLFFHVLYRKLQAYEQLLSVLADRCEQAVRRILEGE
jgi:biopolymer transport protein TolQ